MFGPHGAPAPPSPVLRPGGPLPPRDVWEGLRPGCTPPPRWPAASPGSAAPALPAPVPPARCPALGANPGMPTAAPAAQGSRRRQESYRRPVQGRAAAACAKLGVPEAALAACRPPSRPRRTLRSPCRRAAISDKRLRNLPKSAGPEMAEPGLATPAGRGCAPPSRARAESRRGLGPRRRARGVRGWRRGGLWEAGAVGAGGEGAPEPTPRGRHGPSPRGKACVPGAEGAQRCGGPPPRSPGPEPARGRSPSKPSPEGKAFPNERPFSGHGLEFWNTVNTEQRKGRAVWMLTGKKPKVLQKQ